MTTSPGQDTSLNVPVNLLSYDQDILAELARHIIAVHGDSLPDLTGLTILLPTHQSNTQLRKLLLEEAGMFGYSALLGPEIDTLQNWISQTTSGKQNVLSEHQRELMLVEALVKHPDLHGEASPWSLADSLLELFDELSERDIRIPQSFDEFLKQVDKAYQNNNEVTSVNSEELMGEARLVHTLWLAWQQQMKESGIIDRHTSYLLKLRYNEYQDFPERFFYLAGFSQFSLAESNWLKNFIRKNNASLWLQCAEPPGDESYHPDVPVKRILSSMNMDPDYPVTDDEFTRCLNSIFNTTDVAIQARARQFAKACPESPVLPRLFLFEAMSSEHEAMAIDLQTRQWCIAGKKKIGIVTENRRLARRVRALLERANIQLQDAAGWALSTTSAAAILERWLETVEEDFAYQPLLDLLKSPFFFPANKWPGDNKEDLLTTVYRFEQGVVLHENVTRGLARYRTHAQYRQNRLPEELASGYNNIYTLLDIVEEAAKPLTPFIGHQYFNPYEILEALKRSLEILELDKNLANDDAGQLILEELQNMQAATSGRSLRVNWSEFRNWLGRTLEQFNFKPNRQTGQVQLMSMAQCPLDKFDALIIAGAEKEYLPGSTNTSPFFNDGVRQALGLSSHVEQLTHRFYLFRRLLESANEVLITRRVENEDELVVCSPWVENIKSFHVLAYGNDLVNRNLSAIVGNSETIITDRSAPLPEPIAANPSVSVNDHMLPGTISASAYQQLVDCPYQFFAARCLKLKPEESIKEMLEKSDYGERVHSCLQAFHSGTRNLPGPFNMPLTEKYRDEAIDFLNTIAKKVFAKDLEDNFLHRAWLKQWQELIPAYIDWQIGQQENWKVEKTEVDIETSLEGLSRTLRGRIDRIDTSQDGDNANMDILDYKTGRIARIDDVNAGESIQLPFYALLARQHLGKKATRAEFVSIDNGKVQAKSTLEGDDLNVLTDQVGQRLVELI
ncbi:PD-(D/E)XK nuclease family protein, partial [Kaarinaea lacus]